MIISNTDPAKCSVKGCKNQAEFYIPSDVKGKRFYLCRNCKDELARWAVASITPKSPKNTIKKILEEKQKENLYGN